MSDREASALASEDEINAALAEAERQAAGIPSLDDGSSDNVVPIPVEVEAPAPARPKSPPRIDPAERVVVTTVPSEEPPLTSAVDDGEDGQPAEKRTRWRLTLPAWLTRGGWFVYEGVDLTLWAVNRPFEWMKPETRQLTGLLAIATIATSVLAMHLIPMLAPPGDAISVIKRQTAAAREVLVEQALPDEATTEKPAAEPG